MSESSSTGTENTITIYELFERATRTALEIQQDDGSFPPSKSGVYNRPETPVRSTARLLDILVYVHERTGNDQFSGAANIAANYLLSSESRPSGRTFHSRRSGNDRCDGLVGQSAPIRSLARAGAVLDRPELTTTAVEVFSLHPFNTDLGLWKAVEIDGEQLSFDRTLNHQIIFANAATELIDHSELAKNRVLRFLDRLGDNMQTRPNGIVRHYVRPPVSRILSAAARNPRHWPLLWNEAAARYLRHSDDRRQKELGYHPTVLAALSTLKQKFPTHDVWKRDQIQDSLTFANTETYRNQVRNRTSQYGSMLPGINHARVLHAFDDASPEKLRPWVQSDINRTYDPDSGLLTRNAVDPMFQASSISAATELPDMEIQVPDGQNSESY